MNTVKVDVISHSHFSRPDPWLVKTCLDSLKKVVCAQPRDKSENFMLTLQ